MLLLVRMEEVEGWDGGRWMAEDTLEGGVGRCLSFAGVTCEQPCLWFESWRKAAVDLSGTVYVLYNYSL